MKPGDQYWTYTYVISFPVLGGYFFGLGDVPGISVVQNSSGPWWSLVGASVWGKFFKEFWRLKESYRMECHYWEDKGVYQERLSMQPDILIVHIYIRSDGLSTIPYDQKPSLTNLWMWTKYPGTLDPCPCYIWQTFICLKYMIGHFIRPFVFCITTLIFKIFQITLMPW